VGGFDFGSGCEAGSGSFIVDMPVKGATIFMPGVIPPDKKNVYIRLEATSDIDVSLYDHTYDEDGKWPAETGKAVVAWCGNPVTCNVGVLGMEMDAGRATYIRPGIEGMDVTYSGYNGVFEDGVQKFGNEYIYINGRTTAELKMSAFAYETGSAKVIYSWDGTSSPCCDGEAACEGEPFEREIEKSQVVVVGEIPAGVLNVEIQLTGPGGDIDVQLVDTTVKVNSYNGLQFEEGNAIIGWCGNPYWCNFGILAGSDHESVQYPVGSGPTYEYSGYSGVGGNPGAEYINIRGKTDRKLLMRAFGYTEGTATITYSYWEEKANRESSSDVPEYITMQQVTGTLRL
jgi:hypothetical protein